VRMRRRKPCVLARRRLFGWKVRLLTRFSVGCGCSPTQAMRREAPGMGLGWPMRPQSASPRRTEARRGPASGPWACERGRRHARSTIRERRKEGQTGGPSRPEGREQTILGRPCAIARRHAANRKDLFPTRLSRRACTCRFSTSRSLPDPCTGCGQTCGQQGIVHQGTDASSRPNRQGRAPARVRSVPGSQQVQRN
jgi:hypothetical protein